MWGVRALLLSFLAVPLKCVCGWMCRCCALFTLARAPSKMKVQYICLVTRSSLYIYISFLQHNCSLLSPRMFLFASDGFPTNAPSSQVTIRPLSSRQGRRPSRSSSKSPPGSPLVSGDRPARNIHPRQFDGGRLLRHNHIRSPHGAYVPSQERRPSGTCPASVRSSVLCRAGLSLRGLEDVLCGLRGRRRRGR